MIRIADRIDALNAFIGRTVAWAALAIVVVQFGVVILRYAFGVGSVWLQEGLIYMFATLFMLASAHTLARGGHVRVDIFYRDAGRRTKLWIDLLGTVFFLWPVALTILVFSWPYVSKSVAILERSQETSGIPAVFVLKIEILVFAVLLALQGLAIVVRCLAGLAGHAPPPAPSAAPAHGG